MDERVEKICAAAAFVREKLDGKTPVAGIVLGSGLGNLADEIEEKSVIPYSDVPYFSKSTAVGHKGNLIAGFLNGKYVIAMQGRFHYYEGYSMEQVTLPIRVMSMLGISLNLMSAIGIVVSCGIIINDSILKLDMINVLRNEGTPLLEAIHTAGSRRLRSIVMTSLTTILAMVPLLFTHDFGSELQKPLAIAMIATMTVGTLVSLFVIPLIYWFIYRNKPITVQ